MNVELRNCHSVVSAIEGRFESLVGSEIAGATRGQCGVEHLRMSLGGSCRMTCWWAGTCGRM
jgi:hypothetical protein